MTIVPFVFNILMVVWILSEAAYNRFLKSKNKDNTKDKSTLSILWVVIMVSIFISIWLSRTTYFPIINHSYIHFIGLFFIFIGIVFRLYTILSLGKYFTVDVAIQDNHKIKKDGFYRYVRHPSYLFSLITFWGFGLYLNNYAALTVALLFPFLAFWNRIKQEEKVLTNQFGGEYINYCKKTKRLIPFLL